MPGERSQTLSYRSLNCIASRLPALLDCIQVRVPRGAPDASVPLHGIAPVHRSHPAYRYMRDGDGVVCEYDPPPSGPRRRQRGHRLEVAFEALADALAVHNAAQELFFQGTLPSLAEETVYRDGLPKAQTTASNTRPSALAWSVTSPAARTWPRPPSGGCACALYRLRNRPYGVALGRVTGGQREEVRIRPPPWHERPVPPNRSGRAPSGRAWSPLSCWCAARAVLPLM